MRDRQCRTCRTTFKGGPRAWYCPDCRLERKREQSRKGKQRERDGLTRKIGSVDECDVCRNDYIVTGGLQRMCSNCRDAEYKRIDQELSLKYYEKNKERINPVRNEHRREKRADEKIGYDITCVASDCGKPFKSIMSHAKYCSDKCRWRDAKRKQIEERKAAGLCPQCGGEMITPIAIFEKAPNYCEKCQDNFQRLYKNKTEKDD